MTNALGQRSPPDPGHPARSRATSRRHPRREVVFLRSKTYTREPLRRIDRLKFPAFAQFQNFRPWGRTDSEKLRSHTVRGTSEENYLGMLEK